MRVLWVLAILTTAQAAAPHSQRIVGGTAAPIEKYPFMVNLVYWNPYSEAWRQGCAGSILNELNVLSAAHCFSDELFDLPSTWRIRAGSPYPWTGGTVLNAREFTLHEDFESPTPLNNDIAIVHLASRLTFSASISNVRIAGSNYHLPYGTEVTVMGWGRTIWGGAFPDQLQEVDIYIISQEICYDRYEFLRNISVYSHYPMVTDKMICAGIPDRGGRDSCSGDSGGPVVHDGNVAIGITSWAYGCADPWYPGVNVRVSSFVDWILANVQNY